MTKRDLRVQRLEAILEPMTLKEVHGLIWTANMNWKDFIEALEETYNVKADVNIDSFLTEVKYFHGGLLRKLRTLRNS